MTPDRALILAAGRGSRLSALTAERPKCLVPFQGRALLDWQMKALRRIGIDEIHVVRGYRGELLEGCGVRLWDNPAWDSSNMVYSLFCASPVLRDDEPLLITYGDVIYEPRVLREMFATRGDLLVAVNRQWRPLWEERMANPLDDVETLRISSNGDLTDIGRKAASLDEIDGQYMGLVAVTPAGLKSMIRFYETSPDEANWMTGRNKRTCYMTDLLRGLISAGVAATAAPVNGGWLEFDTPEDLGCYERLARSGDLKQFFDTGEAGGW
ncbi:MAG: NTP transferase domain-containing protein [Gammaproteobacteria bacterium]